MELTGFKFIYILFVINNSIDFSDNKFDSNLPYLSSVVRNSLLYDVFICAQVQFAVN